MGKKSKKPLQFKAHQREERSHALPPMRYHALTLGGEGASLALDATLGSDFRHMASMSCHDYAMLFPGYPFLQFIAQNSLISSGVETIADEMTRNWVTVSHGGENEHDDAVEDKIKALEADLKNFKVQTVFRSAAEKIGYYGGCVVVFNIKGQDDPEILKTPLYLDPTTFKQGSLKDFVVVDPINIYPGFYNTIDPTRDDYFVPSTWWVLGKEIHKSRLLYFAGKEAPLLWKPAYNFFGISSAQLAWDYVQNFTGNRDSASELLNKFSVTVLKTNMENVLQGDSVSSLQKRIQYFNDERNNSGTFALDKELEDLVKVDTSLSGVTDIVRQALEMVATVFRIPAVKYLGISPSGFNATGESDIRNFYDFIESLQQKQLAENMERVLQILQMNLWGEIDTKFFAEWKPLGKEDAKLKAETEKLKADTIAVYADRAIIDPEEARKVLTEDTESPFHFIDADAVPEALPTDPDIDDVDKSGALYG